MVRLRDSRRLREGSTRRTDGVSGGKGYSNGRAGWDWL